MAALHPAVRTTQFMQGHTTRWGVAWSFAKESGNLGATPLQPGGARVAGDGVGAAGAGAGVGASAALGVVKACYRMTFELQVGRSSARGKGDTRGDGWWRVDWYTSKPGQRRVTTATAPKPCTLHPAPCTLNHKP